MPSIRHCNWVQVKLILSLSPSTWWNRPNSSRLLHKQYPPLLKYSTFIMVCLRFMNTNNSPLIGDAWSWCLASTIKPSNCLRMSTGFAYNQIRKSGLGSSISNAIVEWHRQGERALGSKLKQAQKAFRIRLAERDWVQSNHLQTRLTVGLITGCASDEMRKVKYFPVGRIHFVKAY